MSGYVVALTGASGAIYGVRLVRELISRGDDVDLVISPSGFLILKEELGADLAGTDSKEKVKGFFEAGLETTGKGGHRGSLGFTPHDCLSASFASGSALKKAMVICPCSMGTLSRVSSGNSGNLIERSADCMIKEKRTLVLVPRETPLSPIHLENMLKLSRMGVTILPPMPAFYTHPEHIGDMVDFVVGKVLDVLGIENSLYKRWKKS